MQQNFLMTYLVDTNLLQIIICQHQQQSACNFSLCKTMSIFSHGAVQTYNTIHNKQSLWYFVVTATVQYSILIVGYFKGNCTLLYLVLLVTVGIIGLCNICTL